MLKSPLDGLISQENILDGLNIPGMQPQAPVAQADPDRTARMAALVNSTAIQEIQGLTQKFRQEIEANGDDAIRTQAAVQQQRARMQALTGLATTSTESDLVKGAREAAIQVIGEDIQKQKESALELATIHKIQDVAATDRTQARVLLDNFAKGGADQRITDINVKQLILQREIEKAGIAKEAQPWFRDLMDFVVSSVPFANSASQIDNVDTKDVVKNWGDVIFAGRRVNNEANNLWMMDVNQFSKYVREHLVQNVQDNANFFGYHNRTAELNVLSGMNKTPSALEVNAWNALDNFGWVPFTKFGKAGGSLVSTLVKNGARKQASEALAETFNIAAKEGAEAAAAKTGISAEEAASASLPSAVNPDPITTIPLAGDTITAFDRMQELVQKLPEALPSDRFASSEEFTAALDKLKKQVEASYGRSLVNVDVIDRPMLNGSKVRDLEITMGKKDGGGFARETEANKLLASTGNAGEVVRDESGLYFVKFTQPMSETGFLTVELKPATGKVLGVSAADPLAANVFNARLVNDKLLANQAQRGTNQVNRLIKETVKPIAERLNAISPKSKGQIAALLDKGREEGKWFTKETRDAIWERTFGKPMSAKEHDAYEAYREASDIDFLVRNEDLYMQKHVKGFQTISLDTGIGAITEENALINRILDRIPNDRVYNVSRGIHMQPGTITKDAIDAMKAEGHILVTTEKPIKLADGTYVKNFLVKADKAVIRPLRRDQLAYRAGGHTFYKDKYFAKQGVKRIQPDTFKEFLDNPSTFIAGTKAEVDHWTGKMERARQLYVDMEKQGAIDMEVLDEALADTPISSEQFVNHIEDGTFQKDMPFETVYDREMPSAYQGVDPEAVESTDSSWYRTNNRMYYSRKGEDLPNFKGDRAEILDPYMAINKALQNVANMTSFADYKISATERWVNTFGQYFNLEGSASTLTNFVDATPKKGVNQGILNVAEKQRDLIKRTLGWKTPMDMKHDYRLRTIAEWVNGENPNGIRNAVTRNVSNWFNNNNPVEAIRGLAFDAKLGLFNIAQLPLQMSTMASIISLSPKYGTEAMGNLIFVRQFLTKSGTEHLLDEYVKRGVHTLSGFKDPKEFKAFMRATKKSGFLDIGGTHGLINSAGPDAALSSFGSDIENLREKARFFFNEGELYNRITAMHVAWKETREMFPGLDTNSADFIRRWEGRSEEYGFNMSRESQAWWQRGVMSIPTQFWAYQSRMFEAIFGNTFSPAQRFRLALGQTVLYGSAGLPFVNLVSEKVHREAGGAPAVDTFWGTVDRGVLDRFFYEATGADMAIGERFATGSWMGDTIKDILGFSSYGEKKSVLDIATGATGSTVFRALGDGANIIDKFTKYSIAESGGNIEDAVTKDDWIRLASNITTISNAHKAFLIDRLGTIETKKGQTLYSDIPSSAAWQTMLFGADVGQSYDLSAKLGYLKDKSKQVDEAAKVFENYRVKMFHDPSKGDQYSREVVAYSRLLPPDIRQRALAKVHSRMSPSMYDGVVKQMEKEAAKQEMIKNVQQ